MVNESIIDEGRIKEYEGLTLDTVISFLRGYIKIGTISGNGFVFGGTVNQYKNEREDVDKSLGQRVEKTYENAKKNVAMGIKCPHASVSDYMSSLLKSVDDNLESVKPTMDGYMEFLEKKLKYLSERADKLTVARERYEAFKKSGDRVVKKAYKTTTQFDPIGTVILLVEGGESGEAWTVEDYRKAVEEAKEKKAEKKKSDVIPFDSEEYDEVFGDDK